MGRFALVVGISDYFRYPLPNSVRDARAVHSALQSRQFNSVLLENPTRREMLDELAALARRAIEGDLSLIYFAGHGVEYHGAGYVLPTDYAWPVSPDGLQAFAISNSALLEALVPSAGAKVLVLDACRNWPERPGELLRDLDQQRLGERAGNDVMIAYSTSAEDVALDGPPGQLGRYCEALSKGLLRHDRSIEECFREVAEAVIRSTGNKQRPWSYSSLTRPVSFSDLPRFHLIQTFKLPLDESYPLFLAADPANDRVIAAGGNSTSWGVSVQGMRQLGRMPRQRIIASASINQEVAHLCPRGLFIKNGLVGAKTGVRIPDGLVCSSPQNLLAVYGNTGLEVFRLDHDVLEKVFVKNTDWPVHAVLFIDEGEIVIAGGRGHVARLGIDRESRHPFDVTLESKRDIYGICLLPDGGIACAGYGGLCVVIDPTDGSVKQPLEMDELLTTAAARRASLLDWMDDGRIDRFLFHPETLPDYVKRAIEHRLPLRHLMSCAHHPSLPILAIGDSEGVLHFRDMRDGQTVQTFDTAAGRGADLQGICFLTGGALAALAKDGTLIIFRSEAAGEVPRGPFLNSEQEDRDQFGEYDY